MSDSTYDDLRNAMVVLVNYRSRHHIEDLLRSWPSWLTVTVVDNSANQDGIRDLMSTRDRGRYIDGRGQGFARAANMGAFSSDSDVLVFVNPDSRPDVEDLGALVRGLRADPSALSHAATMAGHDGQTEIGVAGWEPTLWRTLVYALALHKLLPTSGLFARPAPGEGCNVQWTTGACMAVNADAFRSVGGFDEMFYVYAEDMSLGRRARQAGLQQVLRPDVRVLHGAGSSGAPSHEMLRLRGASFANYMLSYHPPMRAHSVLGTIGAGYLLRGVVSARHDRASWALHVAFVKGLITRRATVGGVEVADRRFREVSAGIGSRTGMRGFLSLRCSV